MVWGIRSGYSKQVPVVCGAFKFQGIFFSGMEADRNVKVVGGDVAVL